MEMPFRLKNLLKYKTMDKISLVFIIFIYTLVGHGQTSLTQAEDFNAKDSEGNVYNLFDILNDDQFVLIDFFDISCGPCQFFAPDIQQSYVNFGENNADVFFIGLSLTGDNALLDEWDSTFGIQYPTVSGTQGGGFDIHQIYKLQTYPTLVLIAPDHSIADQIYLPDFIPNTATIDSLLLDHGLTPVVTDRSEAVVPKENAEIIFNNPVSDILKMSYYNSANSKSEIVIFNSLGQLIWKVSAQSTYEGINHQSLNVADLPHGLYFISLITSKNIVEHHKLIKQ